MLLHVITHVTYYAQLQGHNIKLPKDQLELKRKNL